MSPQTGCGVGVAQLCELGTIELLRLHHVQGAHRETPVVSCPLCTTEAITTDRRAALKAQADAVHAKIDQHDEARLRAATTRTFEDFVLAALSGPREDAATSAGAAAMVAFAGAVAAATCAWVGCDMAGVGRCVRCLRHDLRLPTEAP